MNFLKIFCIALIGYTNGGFAHIIETADLKIIESVLEKADQDTLVIFDVDDVLIMPTAQFAFTHPIRKKLTKKTQGKIFKRRPQNSFQPYIFKANCKACGLTNAFSYQKPGEKENPCGCPHRLVDRDLWNHKTYGKYAV